MSRNGFVALLVIFVVCSSYGKDFKSLGHHTWRCKEKLKTAKKAENVSNNSSNLRKSTLPIAIDESTEVSNCSHVKCSCGKQGCQVAWDQRHQILLEKLPKVAKQVFSHNDVTKFSRMRT